MATESADAPAGTGRLAHFLFYGASRTIVESLSGARGMVLAVVLGPEAFGIWALFRLICRYGALLNLGILPGVEIEVVRARSGGEPDGEAEAERWGRAAASYTWGLYGPLSIALLAASFWNSEPDTVLMLRALAFGLILDRFWTYSRTYLRVVQSLRWYAISELWYTLFQLVLSCAGAWVWGLPGAFAGYFLGFLLGLLLVARNVPFRPIFSSLRLRLRRLLGIGMPLISVTVLMLGLTTVDRFVIAAIGGAALLGIYSFAVAVAGFGASLAWSIRTVVVPDVLSRAGEANATSAQRHIEATLKPFALLYPLLLGLVAILVSPIIFYFTPQYREAIPVAQLFVFTGVTAGLHGLGVLPVVAAGRQRAVPLVAAVTFTANALFALIAVSAGWSLWVVAAGAVGARTMLSAGILRLAVGITPEPRPWITTLKMISPLVWCIVAVSTIVRTSEGMGPLEVLLMVGLYLVSISPWFPAAARAVRRARVDHA